MGKSQCVAFQVDAKPWFPVSHPRGNKLPGRGGALVRGRRKALAATIPLRIVTDFATSGGERFTVPSHFVFDQTAQWAVDNSNTWTTCTGSPEGAASRQKSDALLASFFFWSWSIWHMLY